ncbi:MAG TPA: Maf family protein [Fimbriimonadaceae bacterium]|nr:Maf family protein [Fimbriimonadaceae bacterium]
MIVLASASPRRKELLGQVVPEFIVDPADVDEEALTENDPRVTAEKLAIAKAIAVADRHPGATVIGSDTVVAIDGVQLAKPLDAADAFRMLSTLAGRTHTVFTGVALVCNWTVDSFVESSDVTFRPISDDEIWAYIATGEPMDKAGAYGIQAGGGTFIEHVEGLVSTVVGLPIERLSSLLTTADR